jgi:hypothetical protein
MGSGTASGCYLFSMTLTRAIYMRSVSKSENLELQPASEGVGPLLQRDYWAVLKDSKFSPRELMDMVCRKFCDFPPKDLVQFTPPDKDGPLDVGDQLGIGIRMMSRVAVRVIHKNDLSLTLGTLKGHPEAGRITFGAYPNDRGDVIFHIRSRARAGSLVDYAGYLFTGDPMQTNTWTDYIDYLAHLVAHGVHGCIHVEQQEVELEDEDEAMNCPTYIAREE